MEQSFDDKMSLFVYATLALISLFLFFARCYPLSASHFSRLWHIGVAKPLFRNNYNQLNPLQSRAIPNQRLCVVFGIDNAFTSHDALGVKKFVVQAQSLINLSPTAWNNLSEFVRGAARHSIKEKIPDHGGEAQIRVMDLVQALTLRVALRVLFSMREEACDLPDSCLIELASAINSTWMMSKVETMPLRFENNSRLQNALLAIFPATQSFHPQKNPLNMILPGFETTWRIVLCLFIEAGFVTGFHHPEWRTQLAAFAHTPSKAVFTQIASQDNVSVEYLVNEALRLYPPTKRLYRAFQCHDSRVIDIEAADIERSHTAAHIWGPGALSFDPTRWYALKDTQKRAFTPFGRKPFVCPAQSVFGPRIIGLIVGVLLMEVGDNWTLKSTENGCRDLNPGTRLRNERDSHDCLYLTDAGSRLVSQEKTSSAVMHG